MKALVYTSPNRVELQEMEKPRPASGEALVRVEAAGICGSDMSGFLGHSARRRPPLVLGHEVAGILEEVEGEGFSPGDRVCVNPLFSCLRCEDCLSGRQNLCRQWRLLGLDNLQGAFAEYVRVPVTSLVSLPRDLPLELAALPEPVANGVHLLSLAGGRPFGTLAIFGAGTQGTLLLCLAKALGYQKILVSDVNAERLAIAAKLGAAAVFHSAKVDVRTAVLDVTAGRGVDVAIDAVGAAKTRQDASHVCKPGGVVFLLGLAEDASSLEFIPLIRKEIRLQTSFAYTANDFRKAVELVVQGAIEIRPWTEIRVFEEGQTAFEKMVYEPGGILKMLLRP